MNTIDTPLTAHPKVQAIHQQRLAYVYVRQSSPKQVAQNLESQQLQYQLAQRAEELGWRSEQVRIIDEDQGLSGKESAGRDGFQDLVAEVSLGQVGIVFGYQVSRLARNNADWYHLLDLAAVFDTLIADADGVYNLRDYNDRLILGLKGTMSEAELHWLHQRLDDGRMNKVRRGEYRQRLPTGLVRLDDGTVIKHPDDQVRHTLELVFQKFEELGSCSKVMRYLRRADILLPRQQLSGPFQGQLVWKHAAESAIYGIIKNPAYAGAFAYGRTRVDPTRRQPGKRSSGIIQCPMEDWQHLQLDVYPAYISWDQYLANQERLHQGATRFAQQTTRKPGNPREGAALLQGLAVCGECGHRLSAGYKPEMTPTTKHVTRPRPIQAQGMRKLPPTSLATRLPIRIPRMTPTIPPAWQMMIASVRNWDIIARRVAPRALLMPISLVRSVTETSMMFIRPIEAPRRVMRPIAMVAIRILTVFSLRISRSPVL